jgi:hypothetical protein
MSHPTGGLESHTRISRHQTRTDLQETKCVLTLALANPGNIAKYTIVAGSD